MAKNFLSVFLPIMKIHPLFSAQIYRSFGAESVKNGDSFSNCPLKTGDEIPYVGKVAAEPLVFNIKTKSYEKCLLLYQNDEKDGSLRLVKNEPEKLKKLSMFYARNPRIRQEIAGSSFTISDETMRNISRTSPAAAEIIKETGIAQIVYTTLNKPEELNRLRELGYRKINAGGDIICIQNFIVNQKNYKDAFKIVAAPLMRALHENGEKNIVQKAIAFGEDSYSPVNLYLYFGFKPLSIDMQSLENSKIQTRKGLRIDPELPVVMYLPEDAILYKLLERIPYKMEGFYRKKD